MDEAQREALASLRLTWAPTADDLWRPQAETHVKGLNEYAADDVMEAFGDAARDPVSTSLGVVVRGPAGSGKTHLLGQIRERVQSAGGYFFVVELLDAASFWQSVRSGILDSLGRWPIMPAAFADAPDLTPRQLLIRADAHVRECLKHDEIIELDHLTSESERHLGSTVAQRFCRRHPLHRRSSFCRVPRPRRACRRA